MLRYKCATFEYSQKPGKAQMLSSNLPFAFSPQNVYIFVIRFKARSTSLFLTTTLTREKSIILLHYDKKRFQNQRCFSTY